MDLENRRIFPEQWCSGHAQCIQCGHEWTATWPLAAAPLECPHCQSTDTYRERKSDKSSGKLSVPHR